MAKQLWNFQFPYTLAFNLFRKHFTELNKAYWSFIPASNTIISQAKKSLITDDADPKTFFLIRDEDDRRMAPTFSDWKADFSEFTNYTRLNMVMLISSCFETYLRTVISNAFESKPGAIIMCPDSVDGAFLLKRKAAYGNSNDKDYQFSEQIDEICRGDWIKRFSAFEKYFGKVPEIVFSKATDLNELRVTRNNIGHYLGRTKSNYSAPIYFSPVDVVRISHERILKYFKLVYDVTKELDYYLKINFIGSYDVIKCYFQQVSQGNFSENKPGVKAREFQRLLGSEDFPTVGAEYYRNIIDYCDLDSPNDLCRYSMKACIKEINRQLNSKKLPLILDGHAIRVGEYHFKLFVRTHNWRTNTEYCQKNPNNSEELEYRYSMKLIDEIVEKISANPDSIMKSLQEMKS